MDGKHIPHEESKKKNILVVKGREKNKGDFFLSIFTNEEPEIFLILFFLNFYFTVNKTFYSIFNNFVLMRNFQIPLSQ